MVWIAQRQALLAIQTTAEQLQKVKRIEFVKVSVRMSIMVYGFVLS